MATDPSGNYLITTDLSTIKKLVMDIKQIIKTKKLQGTPDFGSIKVNGVKHYYLKYNPANTDAYFAYAQNRWNKMVSQSSYMLPDLGGKKWVPEPTNYRSFLLAAGVLGQKVSAFNNYDIATLKKIKGFDSSVIPKRAEVEFTVDVGGEGRYDAKKYGGAIDINIRATSQILPYVNNNPVTIPHFVYGDATKLQSFLPGKFAKVVITEGTGGVGEFASSWANGLVHIVAPGGTIKLHFVTKALANAVIAKAKMAYGNGVKVETGKAVFAPYPPKGFEKSKEDFWIITIPK